MPKGRVQARPAARCARSASAVCRRLSRSRVMRLALGTPAPALRFITMLHHASRFRPPPSSGRAGAWVSATSTSPLGSTSSQRGWFSPVAKAATRVPSAAPGCATGGPAAGGGDVHRGHQRGPRRHPVRLRAGAVGQGQPSGVATADQRGAESGHPGPAGDVVHARRLGTGPWLVCARANRRGPRRPCNVRQRTDGGDARDQDVSRCHAGADLSCKKEYACRPL